MTDVPVHRFVNRDLRNIVTPVNVEALEHYLRLSQYDEEKSRYLVGRFKEGFDLGYQGPTKRQDTANNIPLKVGSKVELWNKIMKEVKEKRYAGSYKKIPYKNYIQSPVGLVPKDGGKETRLIFHLSYDFKDTGQKSVNFHTDKEECSVHYCDIDYAIQSTFKWCGEYPGKQIFYGKTDVKSAFRLVPLSPHCYQWLFLKARDPETDEIWYFADKNLPFGHSKSCKIFQDFSDALKHITEFRTRRPMSVTNYLDDFLFVSTTVRHCNFLIKEFLNICAEINVPIAVNKTVWSTEIITFLGILLDGKARQLRIPQEKRIKALNLLEHVMAKRSARVEELEKLSGYLNFLNRAIHPGRAFTRRMYSKFSGIIDGQMHVQ